MRVVRSIRKITPAHPNGKTVLYMLGYGGRTWQARRQLAVLSRAGYSLLVIDFTDVLKRHNPQDLVRLMDEVSAVVEADGLAHENTVIVGVSLGGLVGYNLIRRYPRLTQLVVVTGGDMTRIPSPRMLKQKWHMSREQLAEHWKGVNMYTPVGQLRGKRVVMLLPKRDRVIDPNEVSDEIAKQSAYNDFKIIRTPGGHIRTIITQTIVRPKVILPIIENIAK